MKIEQEIVSVIFLTDRQETDLVIMLNLRLRDNLAKDYKERLNGIYKQLVGHDHESMGK